MRKITALGSAVIIQPKTSHALSDAILLVIVAMLDGWRRITD